MSKKVEELIAQRETVTNEALKRALDAHIEAESKEQERRLLAQFTEASRILNERIDRLRSIREQEKRQMKLVKKTNEAFEAFKQDGDWNKFSKDIQVY